MKKILSIVLGVFLLLGVASLTFFSNKAFAETTHYDMWKGIFVRANNDPDAEGKVMLNYAKGQDAYIINVEASGLIPEEDYHVFLLTTYGFVYPLDQQKHNYYFGSFITDEYGYGHYHQNKIDAETIHNLLGNDNIRMVIYKDFSYSNGWVLSTSSAVSGGDFQAIGSERAN